MSGLHFIFGNFKSCASPQMEPSRTYRRDRSQRGKINVLVWVFAAAFAGHTSCFTTPRPRVNRLGTRCSTSPISMQAISMREYRRMQEEQNGAGVEFENNEDEHDDTAVEPLATDALMNLHSENNTAAAMEIRFLFGFADTNRTGKVNQHTFGKLMRTYMRFNDQDLAEMWNIADAGDFIDLPKIEALLLSTEAPRLCFEKADHNGDGWLDAVEWKQAFGDAHRDLMTRQALIDGLFSRHDENSDRRLSLLEFRGLIQGGSIRRPSRREVLLAAQNARNSHPIEENE